MEERHNDISYEDDQRRRDADMTRHRLHIQHYYRDYDQHQARMSDFLHQMINHGYRCSCLAERRRALQEARYQRALEREEQQWRATR